MGRKRQYANAAERLRAFRTRKKEAAPKVASQPVSLVIRPKRRTSRPARLAAMGNEAQAFIDELQAWRDCLPESFQESALAGKLDEAIEKFSEVAETLADIDLPRGFGRD